MRILNVFILDELGTVALDKVVLLLGGTTFLIASAGLAMGSAPQSGTQAITPPSEIVQQVLKG